MKYSQLIIIILSFQIFITNCASTDKLNSDTPEGAFAIGEQLEKDERYEEAIMQFRDVTNKHPYSSFALDSKLKIADIQFKRENYIEAQAAYQVFKEFHPKHKQIDYVTYRLAMSYFHQLPSTIDRDLTLANQAIQYFDEVIQSYPSSQWLSDAKENKIKSLKMLAEKEVYIADFYYHRDEYKSALGRYEDLISNYPGLGFDVKVLERATKCAIKLKENNKASLYYNQLIKQFPDSSEAQLLRKEYENGDASN